MNRRSVLRASSGLAAWLLTSGIGCKRDDVDKPKIPTLSIERSEVFVREVKADGTLRAVQATPLTSPQDARMPMKVAWLAEDGSRVDEGDVVVRFDATEMERTLENSLDDVSMAERKIRKVSVTGSASKHKRDATAELADSEAEVAREFESDDEQILSRNEIIESTIDVDLAEAKAAHSRQVKRIESNVSTNELELHRIEKEQSAREVAQARDALQKLQVTAPHAGIVVLNRDWRGRMKRVGDTVWPGQKIAELPLVSEMEAEVYVLEADAGSLAEGQPAQVVVDAHPGKRYSAKVERVDTLAKPRHSEVPVHYFAVTLQLEQTDPDTMRVGARVRTVIHIEQPDAIVIPRQAIFDVDDKRVVYRREGKSFQPVEVELGVSSAGRVVIEQGLNPGDEIALRDPTKDVDELWAPRPEHEAEAEPSRPGGPL